MAISHRVSASVFQTGTAARTVAPDAATAVGEVMVVPVGFQDSAATTITTPAGFTASKSAVQTGTLKTSLFTRTRQAGDSTFSYAPNQSVETAHLVLSLVGADPASLIVGSDGTRAASGGSTATTAPSITTTVAGSRVYVIGIERTTANETVEATVNNGFTKISHTYANGTSAESIFLAYKDMPAAGVVGATTITYQNAQASNGYAVLFAIAPAAVVAPPRGFGSVAEMRATRGVTWAHRGGSASYTEHSLAAFAAAVARGFGVLELSMQRTSDGVWFGCHDLDLARVTGNPALTQDVRAMTWAQVNAYQMTIGSQGPQPFMRWQDFIAAGYGNTHVLVLDPKNSVGTHQAEFLAMVAASVDPARVIMKWAGGLTSFADAAKAAGFKTAGYWYQADYENGNLAAQAPSWDYLGMDYTAGTAWTGPGNIVELAAAQGKKVWGHIAPNQAAYDLAMSKGADMVQVSGVAVVTAIGPAALTGIGSLVLTGSASRTVDTVRASAGVLALGGAASRTLDVIRDALGALVLVGAAARSVDVSREASGVLDLDGSAARSIDTARDAAGNLVLSGAGELGSNGLIRAARGELVLSGLASRLVDVARTAAGAVVLTGTGSRVVDVVRAAAGALVIQGLGSFSEVVEPFPARRTLTPVVEIRTLDPVLITRTLEDA